MAVCRLQSSLRINQSYLFSVRLAKEIVTFIQTPHCMRLFLSMLFIRAFVIAIVIPLATADIRCYLSCKGDACTPSNCVDCQSAPPEDSSGFLCDDLPTESTFGPC